MAETLIGEQIEVGPYMTNCYIVSDDKQALVIDPGDDYQMIEKYIKKNSLKVEKIILTHGHIDHIGAVAQIKKLTDAPVLIHPEDADMLTDAKANLSAYHTESFSVGPADGFLNEGDIIDLGRFQFKVLHTPGHSPGGISLATDGIVFTGDALFWGSVGRTDFPNGSHEILINSIKTKLMTLPDETIVYSGHGPQTTIGHERGINPFLI